MKLTIYANVKRTADVPNGSKLLSISEDWVTWYSKAKDGLYDVSTCHVDYFAEQENVQSIRFTREEIILLGKRIGKLK